MIIYIDNFNLFVKYGTCEGFLSTQTKEHRYTVNVDFK